MDPERVNALLGTDIPAVEQYQYLARVDICTRRQDCPDGPADVTIPSWRGDVEGIADLAEEVARFYGYNNIPATLMRGQTTLGGYSAEQKLERRWASVCRACGYDEIITYSFISPTYYDKIRWPEDYPAPEVLQDPEPPGRGHLHHAHHHPALHAGDPDPELQLPQPGRASSMRWAGCTCPAARTAWPIESKVLTLGAYGGRHGLLRHEGRRGGHASRSCGRRT